MCLLTSSFAFALSLTFAGSPYLVGCRPQSRRKKGISRRKPGALKIPPDAAAQSSQPKHFRSRQWRPRSRSYRWNSSSSESPTKSNFFFLAKRLFANTSVLSSATLRSMILKKEKSSVKLVNRTLIGRLWANAWNGRAEKRKERISLSTTAASTTYCKPVHLCLSLSPTRKTRFKMSVRPFSLNMIYIRAASGSLSLYTRKEKEKRGCIDWSTTSRPSLVRLLLLPILLLFLSLHSLSIDEL